MATNTASSLTTHTGNGSTTAFAISFSFLADSEIDVTVAGVAKTITTHYTISGSTLTFTSGNIPANGAAVRFQRDTDISAKKVDFQDGSVLTEADLDANSDQVLFAQQEIIDKLGTIEEGATGDQTAAEVRTLVESASDSNVFTDADHSKLNAIEASATADQTASEIRTLVESASDSNVFTDADHSKLNAIEASATADQTASEIRTLVESASDSNVFTDADHTKVNNAVTLTDTQTLTNKTLTTPVINDLSGSAVVTSGTSTSDNKVYSAKRAGEIFYGKDTVGEIQSGETWSSTDDKVATTAAIDARVIDLVDDVGGFVPIANELAFPNANPDVNNGAGTLVSIKALSTAYTSNGSGQFTISNGTVGNSTVTITGATASTTFAAGFGMIVETSTTLNTYTFHRLVPKATEVTTVAGNVSNVNTVAGISSNVTTVAGIAANVTTVAGISSNVTSVAGSISNVNTVAGNLSGVNSFAERYSVGSSNPTSNLDVGDLFFNTTANELKVYNGSAWQGGVTATGNFASVTGNVFTGDNRYNDNVKALFGTGSDLQIFHDGSDSYIQDSGTGKLRLLTDSFRVSNAADSENLIAAEENGSVSLFYDNSKKFETNSTGIQIEGSGILNGSGTATTTLTLKNGTDTTGTKLGHSSNSDRGFIQVTESGADFGIQVGGANTSNMRFEAFGDASTATRICAGTEEMITAAPNGAVELYHDNSKKFETNSGGATVTGSLTTDGFTTTTGGDALFTGTTSGRNAKWDTSHDRFLFDDNAKAVFGGGGDLSIFHDGTNSVIRDNGTGNLFLQVGTSNKFNTQSGGVQFYGSLYGDDNNKIELGNDQDLQIYHDGSNSYIEDTGTGRLLLKGSGIRLHNAAFENFIHCVNNGAVELYYDNSKKLDTHSGGVNVTGSVNPTGNVALVDNSKLKLGTGDDLQIYHDGSHSRIKTDSSAAGNLVIDSNNDINLRVNNSEMAVHCHENAGVELYYDNSKKFETTSVGVTSLDTLITHGVIRPAADNNHDIGLSNRRYITIYAVNGSINTSDRTEKNTIVESDLGLDFINKLKPVSYKWNKDDGKTHYGLIAQDIEETITNLGKTVADFGAISKEKDSPMGLSYPQLLSPLIKAVQELSAKVAALEAA